MLKKLRFMPKTQFSHNISVLGLLNKTNTVINKHLLILRQLSRNINRSSVTKMTTALVRFA